MGKNKVLIKKTLFLILLFFFPFSNVNSQDNVETSLGADIVSSYIWRGQDLGNVSIQPSLGIHYKGFSLSAWGSLGFTDSDTKELDLILEYSLGNLTLSITDYWASGDVGYFHYSSDNTSHTFEAGAAYDFGIFSLAWSTNFAGNVGYDAKGNKVYASYVSASVPFKLGGIDWSAEVGASPWSNDYYNDGGKGFQVSSVSITAAKELKITEHFSIPFYGQVVWNPYTDGAWFVAGLSF